MKVLSIIPPLVQINTPYPSTSFLTGFLRSIQYDAVQRDIGLELILRLFSKSGLTELHQALQAKSTKVNSHPSVPFFLRAATDYIKTIEPVIRFLQGKDPAIAHRLASRTLLPEGPRFQTVDTDELQMFFGRMGVQDQAKHLASLYLDDLVDVVQHGLDANFSLSKYGDQLAASQPTFDPLLNALKQPDNLLDQWLKQIVIQVLQDTDPDAVLITAPFPGCVLGSLKIAKMIKQHSNSIKIGFGGGYVNTELRSLKDARVFDFFDAVTLDDGERPVHCLLEYWSGLRPRQKLFRTFLRSEKIRTAVEYCHDQTEHDLPQVKTGFPTLDGLRMNDYISMVEMLNPMHRFWSDLHWNKLMLAHGCYWHQCSFCDVNLDYIGRYEVSPTDLTLERMKRLAVESGSTGFHFIDEAAPPAILKDLSNKIIEQGLSYSWWGNIRFEKTFTPELAEKMADAGCVAVSGGLEVASDRLLKLMKKGVTVEQVARVTHAFQTSKVMVHAYLMYGFPTETVQETIDSLERVRQLFLNGCLTSAFWHRFSATAHSPIGHDPDAYGIQLHRHPDVQFAENDVPFTDTTGVDHDELGVGLRKALYNYMLGIGLDADVRSWFEVKVPKTTVDPKLIKKALEKN
jgi:hypothetical protein